MFIRELVVVTDMQECAELVESNFPGCYDYVLEDLRGSITERDKSKFFVYETDGYIVGLAAVTESPMDFGVYEITWVNVHKGYRGAGIGSALIKFIIDHVKSRDQHDLVILKCRNRTVSFYEKLGFKCLYKKYPFGNLMGIDVRGKKKGK